MKKIYSIVLFTCSLITPSIHCMELAPAASPDKPKSAKIAFLEKTVEQINQYKTTNTDQYLADMGKVLNATYAVIFLQDKLLKIKKHYTRSKATEEFAFYNGKYINGISTTIFQECTSQVPIIKTPLGNLVDYKAEYGDQEYNFFATTPTERAFYSKIGGFNSAEDRIKTWNFIKKHFKSDIPEIKTMALNSCYLISSIEATNDSRTLISINAHFNAESVKNYLSAFNLKQLFTKEFIATKLVIAAYRAAGEAAPSMIEKLQSFCTSSVCDEFKKENGPLNEYYRTMVKETRNAIAEQATLKINQANLKTKHHELCNQLLSQHCIIKPELETIFKYFGISGYLPGLLPFEKPTPLFTAPKQGTQKAKGKKYKNRRNKKRNKKNAIPHEVDQENHEQEPAETPSTTSTSSSDPKNETNDENLCILYDNRVLEKNKNKKDPYHGFTLLTIPYIRKNGTHTIWFNKKTGHADDLITMQGEIEYQNNGTVKTEYIQCGICIGKDEAIYHIEMKKIQGTEKLAYNSEFPPLSKPITSYNDSISDDYDSKIIAETDYMVQVWDGGLNAIITLYK